MLTYVLDSSAILRFADEEAGVDRMTQLLALALSGECKLVISALNWGEVVYILAGRQTVRSSSLQAAELLKGAANIVDVDLDRASHAGLLKIKYSIAYADAFGVELALDSPDHILVTADYGVALAQADLRIEFLPTKPKQ